jgi:aspartate ammonia-lyase
VADAFREERDALGPVRVPALALYGAQTVRAVANFGSTGPRLGDRRELVRAFGRVKAAAARANTHAGVLAEQAADAVVAAARQVSAGEHDAEFPVALVQGGGGTSWNMNVNEVVANLADELMGGRRGQYVHVHPNDHVNRSQSTNDVSPTSVALAVLDAAAPVTAALRTVAEALEAKAAEFAGLQRLGRTCLQDALPVDAGAVHAGQAHAVRRAAEVFAGSLDPLYEVPLGATAVGTGFGAPEGYRERAVAFLAEETGLPLQPSRNLHAALAFLDPLVGVASAAARAAAVLGQIAADLRVLASGPVGGIGEVMLPKLQPGSSQMPGKVNPVLPELVVQTRIDAEARLVAVQGAAAAGELELNVMEPVAVRHLLEGLEQLATTASLFADLCLTGLDWNRETVARSLTGSRAPAVARALEQGFDAAWRE